MLTAADAIAEFTQAQNLESFEGNRLLRSAVVQQLTVIGEAVAHLSPELQQRYANIPWPDIIGLRNIVVHNYFGIDWEEVWRTVAEDIAVLRVQISGILRDEFNE
jgi:uncharacterized protein with HEPN domain